MKRKDIEKAAIDNIEFQGNLDLGTIIENACRESFVSGANWRINSVWHDASEMPEKKFALVEYDCFPKGHGYLVVPDAREVIESITRWAYLEDLIPNTED